MNETTKDIEGIQARSSIETQAGSTHRELSLVHKPASPRVSSATFIVICVLVIVYSIMIGFVIGVLSNLLYLVLLFPLAIGIFNGKLIADFLTHMKTRDSSQVVMLSILSVIAIYGMLHYGRFAGFQIRASMEISSGWSEALEDKNLSVAKTFVDYILKEETGHSGFVGYMLYKANEGVSIGRLTRSSSFNLGPVLTWLYWLMEFGIILGLTIQNARKPVIGARCESCGNRYGSEKHLGGTIAANESRMLDLIRQKDFVELGKLMEPNAELPSLEIYFKGCEVCGGSSSRLVVRHAFQGAKGALQFKDAAQTSLQPAESLSLLKQLSFSGD